MKYIEELKPGEAFIYDKDIYLLTSDFKRSGDRLAINIKDGSVRWFSLSGMVDQTDLYILEDSNFSPVNPRLKNDTY